MPAPVPTALRFALSIPCRAYRWLRPVSTPTPTDAAATVVLPNGQRYSFDFSPSWTRTELSEAISKHFNIPPERMYVMSQGKILLDDRPLAELNVRSGSTLHVSLRLPGGGSAEGERTRCRGRSKLNSSCTQSELFPGAGFCRHHLKILDPGACKNQCSADTGGTNKKSQCRNYAPVFLKHCKEHIDLEDLTLIQRQLESEANDNAQRSGPAFTEEIGIDPAELDFERIDTISTLPPRDKPFFVEFFKREYRDLVCDPDTTTLAEKEVMYHRLLSHVKLYLRRCSSKKAKVQRAWKKKQQSGKVLRENLAQSLEIPLIAQFTEEQISEFERRTGLPLEAHLEQAREYKRMAMRATRYALDGQLGRSAAVLGRPPARKLTIDEACDAADSLHPKDPGSKSYPIPAPPRISHIDSDTIREALKRCSRGAAPGCDGWTFELISDLMEDPVARDIVTVLINAIANNALPSSVAERMARSRLTIIPKPNSDSKRPIACGNVFLKLACNIIVNNNAAKISEHFHGLQYGILEPNGTEHTVLPCVANIGDRSYSDYRRY